MPLRPIPSLVKPELLRSDVVWLEPRISPVTRLGLVVDLSEFMRVAWPNCSRDVLKRVEQSLRWRAVPSKGKRQRLRPSDALVRLGEDLMIDMHDVPFADPRLPLARYRDGFAIALLALRPLRIRAFASLTLGEHIRMEGGAWRIIVPAELMKNRRPWEGTIPERLVSAFLHYVDEIRSGLLRLRGRWHRAPGDALWISVDGSPMQPKALGEAITKRTPHRLRAGDLTAFLPGLRRHDARTRQPGRGPPGGTAARPFRSADH